MLAEPLFKVRFLLALLSITAFKQSNTLKTVNSIFNTKHIWPLVGVGHVDADLLVNDDLNYTRHSTLGIIWKT